MSESRVAALRTIVKALHFLLALTGSVSPASTAAQARVQARRLGNFDSELAKKPSSATARNRSSWPLTMAIATLAASCEPHPPVATAAPIDTHAVTETAPAHSYNLTLYGYNYTDTEIGSFEVNGQGGGNLEVSTPTAGGGKSTCCVAFHTPIFKPVPVKIRWTRDADTWCEQSVLLSPPISAKPAYFEVHFYRDGHIEVDVTEIASPPRFQLEREHGNSRFSNEQKNINNDSKFSRCKLGYR